MTDREIDAAVAKASGATIGVHEDNQYGDHMWPTWEWPSGVWRYQCRWNPQTSDADALAALNDLMRQKRIIQYGINANLNVYTVRIWRLFIASMPIETNASALSAAICAAILEIAKQEETA